MFLLNWSMIKNYHFVIWCQVRCKIIIRIVQFGNYSNKIDPFDSYYLCKYLIPYKNVQTTVHFRRHTREIMEITFIKFLFKKSLRT